MKINIHSGHNPDGMVGCGAVGLIKESTEARKVTAEVKRLLEKQGHTVYDCTCNNGTSQNDVLNKIVQACNTRKVDLDISIHFNAGANDKAGNGKTTGTEVYVYNNTSKAYPYAERVCNEIARLGYKNRGVKARTDLYYLKNTAAPAMLIECLFVDDKDDVALYDYASMAKAIVRGVCGDGYKDSSGSDNADTVENSTMIVDGQTVNIRRILHNGTNYIAVRDIAEVLGFEVGNQGSTAVLTRK